MTNPNLRDEIEKLLDFFTEPGGERYLKDLENDILQAVSRHVDAVKPEEAIPHVIQKEGQPAVDAIMQADAFNEALDEYQAKLKEGLK